MTSPMPVANKYATGMPVVYIYSPQPVRGLDSAWSADWIAYGDFAIPALESPYVYKCSVRTFARALAYNQRPHAFTFAPLSFCCVKLCLFVAPFPETLNIDSAIDLHLDPNSEQWLRTLARAQPKRDPPQFVCCCF